MMEVKNGAAAQVPIVLVDSTDGMTYETGITAPTIYAGKNGADTASVSNTTWMEPDTTNSPGGYWLTIPPAFNDTNGPVLGCVTKTGCRPYHFAYQVVANVEADTYARVGAPAGASIAADIATRSTLTAQQVWEYVTRELTTSAGGATAQDVWEYATRELTNYTAPLGATATANAAATGAGTALTAAGIATATNVTDARDTVIAQIPRGPGLVAFTYELGEDRDGDGLPDRDGLGVLLYPIAEAYVYATATDSPDLAGMLDGGYTDALGSVTLYLPANPETYFWRHKTGRINFVNPDIEDVS